MAISENGTKLAQLINPQVLADMISAELPNAIVFAPLAEVGRKLQGSAGNTLTMPKYGYIGDASDIAEGADMTIAKMSTTTTQVTVKKAGQGIELTDEAVLSGYGDPVGEAKRQLTMSVANKVDNDMLASLKTATLTFSTASSKITTADLFGARAKFGEKVNEPAVLIINSKHYAEIAELMTGLENTDTVLVGGVVGKIAGLQIAISDKLADNEAFVVRPGALGLELKRDVMVETDRDIIAGVNVITVNEHYVTYLKDETKAVKVTITGAGA